MGWPIDNFGTGRLLGKSLPLVMGILNITPDSFSDGGDFLDPSRALKQAEKMIRAGVDIIDVGGESTRPGALPVSQREEETRVLPVIREIKRRFPVLVSVDTYRSGTAEKALNESGADLVNDISALRFDDRMGPLVARWGIPVILMHMQGEPRNMQKNPRYRDVVAEIRDFFMDRVKYARACGIGQNRIVLDPGIGFGKRFEDNIRLIRELDAFGDLGFPLLIGLSRKSFIRPITGEAQPAARDIESVTANIIALLKGVSIIRVHDVSAARKSILMLKQLTG